jgi:hypothetical protein
MMRLAQQLLLLMLLGQCVASSLHHHNLGRGAAAAEDPPGRGSRQLQQNSGLAAVAATDLDLLATGAISSAANPMAPAPANCRIAGEFRTTLTTRCHSSCHTCSRGAAAANQRPCSCCKPGFFLAPGVVSPSCTPCPAGLWNGQLGQTACRACPRFTTSLRAGSTVCDGELWKCRKFRWQWERDRVDDGRSIAGKQAGRQAGWQALDDEALHDEASKVLTSTSLPPCCCCCCCSSCWTQLHTCCPFNVPSSL